MSPTPSRDADERQRERALGSYELRIDTRPDGDAAWKSLRRALRLSRADDAWLRARVPGVVRRGARVDLLPYLERVHAAGHAAELVPRDPES